MRAAGGAQDIVGAVHVRHPVAEGLVDGVLQDPGPLPYRDDFGAQPFHPENIGALPFHIHLAHVDGALKAELGRHGGGGHPVLAGAGLGNDPGFAHALHQQPLAHDVVRLVRPGVVQVLALDVDASAAEVAGQILGKGERGRPAGVGGHEIGILLPEGGVALGPLKGFHQFVEGGDQDFRQIGAAEPCVVAPVNHQSVLRWSEKKRIARSGR